MQNFRALFERFPSKTIMPVIHGRCISEVELSVSLLTQISANSKWVGLGGVVPLLQHRRARGLDMAPELFIARAIAIVRSVFPASKIHVFGAGGTRTLPAVFALGADSGDSIGWRQAAGYGSIFLPLKSQRVVKWNEDKKPPRRLLDDDDFVLIEKCRCPTCRGKSLSQRLDAFRRHFYERSIHNAWTLLHQSQYWPRSRSALLRHISSGGLGPEWAKAVSSV
jgi:queuine/archaeosine tRNA-ribosyltransferase